jgi:hypothetical protein
MKDIAKIVIAILIVIVAWKILKGIVGLLIGLAVVGVVIFGFANLLEGPNN